MFKSMFNHWLTFALMTVLCWGVYGIYLHKGQMAMNDPALGRYKAFLWVGVAYFITAVLAPLILLWLKGAKWDMSGTAISWSLVAGVVGALGAFGVLLAFGAKGSPNTVMAIVFAGAPVINALASIYIYAPPQGYEPVRPMFWVGVVLAALGGCLVTMNKPDPVKKPGAPIAPAAPAVIEKAAAAFDFSRYSIS